MGCRLSYFVVNKMRKKHFCDFASGPVIKPSCGKNMQRWSRFTCKVEDLSHAVGRQHWSTVDTANVFILGRQLNAKSTIQSQKYPDLNPFSRCGTGIADPANDQCIYAALLISYPRPDSAAAAILRCKKRRTF